MGIIQPSTPANFRTDLASRTVSGPGLRRPATGSPIPITTHPLPPQRQEQTICYTSSNDTRDFSIPHAQVTGDHLPTTSSSSQHYYVGSQYPPPSTPQKQVFTYVQHTPEFTFSRSGYSPQRTPLPGTRPHRPHPHPIRPMTPRHVPTIGGQSGYFSSSMGPAEGARPSRTMVVGGAVGSAVVSASGGRAGSPVSRGGTGVGRGYEVSPVIGGRKGGNGGGDFVAGLNAHGGRR
jgi:hypothetical protein